MFLHLQRSFEDLENAGFVVLDYVMFNGGLERGQREWERLQKGVIVAQLVSKFRILLKALTSGGASMESHHQAIAHDVVIIAQFAHFVEVVVTKLCMVLFCIGQTRILFGKLMEELVISCRKHFDVKTCKL